MALGLQGYDEKRFATTVHRNLLCSICLSVLRDPVLCRRNQNCFCRGCITKHLGNSQTCPTCSDELTEETLVEAPRIVKDILNELNIHCFHIDRGCKEVLQLQYLGNHENTCGYAPAFCTNQGCDAIVNKRDLFHHEGEVCSFRKCNARDEIKEKLADVDRRMGNIENSVATMETKMTIVESKIKRKFDDASGDEENIIVAGGHSTNSVEMFNWRRKTWSPLQSMPKMRFGATSFIYNNQLTIVDGFSDAFLDDMINRVNSLQNPNLSAHWSDSPVKLSAKLRYHSSVVYKDQLVVTGGQNANVVSDSIQKVQLTPPYALQTLSRLPEPRRDHGAEIYEDNLLIVGGRTTVFPKDSLSSVVLYDLKINECRKLTPLPYEVYEMGAVRWGDNIVVVGGADKHGKALDKVFMYNVKTERSHMLPPMSCKRRGCTAVVIRDSIVVLGGLGEQGFLKSVEAFNFRKYTWEQLPEMSKARCLHTAVVV